MEQLLAAGIAAITAIAVTLITHHLAIRKDESLRRQEERRILQLKYLNPLRLAAVENYFRLTEIAKRVSEDGQCAELLYVSDSQAVRAQPDRWYNDYGAYLVSSCYLAACYFEAAARVRRDLPFLRLSKAGATELLSTLRRVSLGYIRNLGVFYVTQDSIGAMTGDAGRVLDYREFCGVLKSDRGEWLERLVSFYVATGRGEHPERVAEILANLGQLLVLVESVIGGGSALQSVLEAEASGVAEPYNHPPRTSLPSAAAN